MEIVLPRVDAPGSHGEAATAEPSSSASYGEHVNYIAHLESLGSDIHRLRHAREAFAKAYPLGESQWLAWINAECRASSNDYALELCKRAVKDYMIVTVWVRWIELEKVENVLGILKLAIEYGAAFHYQEGVRIWRAARESLLKGRKNTEARKVLVLQSYTPLQGSGDQEAEKNIIGSGVEAIRETEDLRSELGWSGPQDWEEVEEMKNVCENFEKKIMESRTQGWCAKDESGIRPDELTYAYRAYAWFLEESKKVFYAKQVLERCVAEAFLDAGLWKEYLGFVRRNNLPVPELLKRAVRNVPQDEELWLAYLRALDKQEVPLNDFLQVYIRCPVKTVEVVSAALQRCRRAMCDNGSALPSILADVCEASNFKKGTQEWAEVSSLQAAITSDLTLMQNIVSQYSTEGRWWMDYIELLSSEDPRVRGVFTMAINAVSSAHVQDIAWKWKRWEALHGTVEDYENAEHQINSRVQSISNQGEKEQKVTGKRGRERRRKRLRRGKKAAETQSLDEHPSEVENMTTVCKGMEIDDHHDQDHGSREERAGANSKRLVSSVLQAAGENGLQASKDPGSSEVHDKELVAEGRQVDTSPATDVAHEFEPCIAFVNNLSFNTSQTQVELFFSTIPGFKEVRLPRRSDGAPKGMAYVEFEDDKGVDAALEKHEHMLGGRTIWVRRSKPLRIKKSQDGEQFGRGRGRRRLGKFKAPRTSHQRQRVSIDGGAGKNKDTAMTNTERGGEEGEEKLLSQTDFRAMLLGKK